jgi:hypothetical protein
MTRKNLLNSFSTVLALTAAGAITLPRLSHADPTPGVFENWASAWERYARETIRAAEEERRGNQERARRLREQAASAKTDAERRAAEAERARREREEQLATQRAQLEQQSHELTSRRATYNRAYDAAREDRLNDRWYRRATDSMRAADQAAGQVREQQERVGDIRTAVDRLEAQETALDGVIQRETTAARDAQRRINEAADMLAENPDLTSAERNARGAQAARDFFTAMGNQGYDARFLLMETRLLGAQANQLKQALDTQLNNTLLGHYVNSQIEKLGTNFCTLASACTASEPAAAAEVPARIRALLQGSREQAASSASTNRTAPRPDSPPANTGAPREGSDATVNPVVDPAR